MTSLLNPTLSLPQHLSSAVATPSQCRSFPYQNPGKENLLCLKQSKKVRQSAICLIFSRFHNYCAPFLELFQPPPPSPPPPPPHSPPPQAPLPSTPDSHRRDTGPRIWKYKRTGFGNTSGQDLETHAHRIWKHKRTGEAGGRIGGLISENALRSLQSIL